MLRGQGILSPGLSIVRAPTPMVPSLTAGTFGLSTGLVTGQSGATANTKGGYVSLGALTLAVDLLRLGIFVSVSRPFLLDVEANGSIVVADLPINFNANVARLVLPLRVPAGDLRVRVSCGNATPVPFEAIADAAVSTVPETATVCFPLAPAGASAESTGITPVTAPVMGSGPGSWVPIGASASALKGIIPFIGRSATTSGRADERYLLEIGTGAPGAEVSIGTVSLFRSSAGMISNEGFRAIAQMFAAGTKFSLRVTTVGSAASGVRTMNGQIHGIW
jgi:hypothetical protein